MSNQNDQRFLVDIYFSKKNPEWKLISQEKSHIFSYNFLPLTLMKDVKHVFYVILNFE